MSLSNVGPAPSWQRCTPTYIKTLPVLDFPFVKPLNTYTPANTVLRFAEGQRLLAFQWCYLRREGKGNNTSFDACSLSEERVKAMPMALDRLCMWFRFNNSRPRSVQHALHTLSAMLSWADLPRHSGRFEALLSDPDLALEALKSYHAYLRSQLQSHRATSGTVAVRDQFAITCLSEIHGRIYKDQIEPLQRGMPRRTTAPEAEVVREFSSRLQAIFDSAAAIILGGGPPGPSRLLNVSASDGSRPIELRNGYGPLRLMELACVAFAGLALVDSGANLSVLQAYEEPDDLEEQLADPDRINLTQKAVKFRAGGRAVEVHLSATSITRLKTYLEVRQALVTSLGGNDIAQMFIRCSYARPSGEPTTICPLDQSFLFYIRRKVARIGATLPSVTLRQLRVYKQQELVKKVPLAAAAKLMGHSIQTAILAYCTAQESTRRGELGQFLGSLQKTVMTASEPVQSRSHSEVIPVGICADFGRPSPSDSSAAVSPDCRKVEGCFFCDNYRLHADAEDMKKLMSCRRVLTNIVPLNDDAMRAERVYTAIVDRINTLLGELKRRQPQVFETVRMAVEEQGQLTRYWANKLQQLHLLGMLRESTAR